MILVLKSYSTVDAERDVQNDKKLTLNDKQVGKSAQKKRRKTV